MVHGLYKISRGSRESQRCIGFSKVGDNIVNQITKLLDAKSVVLLAACSKEIHRQVTDREIYYRCPNYGCSTMVSFNALYTHMVCCFHPLFICMELGCKWAGQQDEVRPHLDSAHSMEVPRFYYSIKQSEPSKPMTTLFSPRIKVIGIGKAGMLFIGQIDGHSMEILLTVSPVRSVVWELEKYDVRVASLFPFCSFYKIQFCAQPKRVPADVARTAFHHYLSKPRTYYQAPQSFVGIPHGFPILGGLRHQPIIPYIIQVGEFPEGYPPFYIYLDEGAHEKAYLEHPQVTIKRQKHARLESKCYPATTWTR